MAIVVLFSTLSFTVDMHYCGDTLVDTSLFHKSEGCGMEIQKPTSNSDCNITIEDCCSDEQLVVQGQDDLKLSFDKLTFDQQLFVATFVYTYINLFEGLDNNVSSYEQYRPPLVIRQIYKIDETYLI